MVVASKKWSAGLLSLGLAAFFAQGCISGGAKFVRTAPDPFPVSPHAPELVAVLPPGTAVGNSVQVGTIEGESSAEPPLTGDHRAEAMTELVKVAAMHGCDAIVTTPPEKRIWATSQGTPLYRYYQSAACFVRLPGGQPKP